MKNKDSTDGALCKKRLELIYVRTYSSTRCNTRTAVLLYRTCIYSSRSAPHGKKHVNISSCRAYSHNERIDCDACEVVDSQARDPPLLVRVPGIIHVATPG